MGSLIPTDFMHAPPIRGRMAGALRPLRDHPLVDPQRIAEELDAVGQTARDANRTAVSNLERELNGTHEQALALVKPPAPSHVTVP